MNCCKKIEDENWLDDEMFVHEYTSFGCSNGKLTVMYSCPFCGAAGWRDYEEVDASYTEVSV